MPDYDVDPQFEQRLEQVLRVYANEAVRSYDATETTQFAVHGRPGAPKRGRPLLPVWLKPALVAALLLISVAAVGFASGVLRLPTNDLNPNPTFEPFSPAPPVSLEPTIAPGSAPPSGEPPKSAVPTNGSAPPAPTDGLATPPPQESPSPGAETASPSTETPGPTGEPSPAVSPTPTIEPSSEPSSTPEQPAEVDAAGAGDLHTCAIRTDAQVVCFGQNDSGELGDGTLDARFSADVPVVGLGDARQVAGGIRFTCALRATGQVACWGEGGSGQLGNGAEDNSAVPVAVVGIDNATQIAVGGTHACALLRDDTVRCWGQARMLGIGAPPNSSEAVSTPVQVNGLDDVVEVAAGWNHTCARRADGTIVCWGLNGDGATPYGQLGDGTLDHAPEPVDVVGISDATAVAAGGWTTCAIRAGGTAWCWGYGERGGLGDGNSTNSSTPVQVSGIDNARRVTVGGWHACALLNTGRAACWGANNWGAVAGQVGDGTATDRPAPVGVANVPRLAQIDAGWIHTVGIDRNGQLWLWGWSADDGGRVPVEIVVSNSG